MDTPVVAQPTGFDKFFIDHLTRVPLVDRIFFLDHLRTMIHAGLSLIEALHVLTKETQNKKLLFIIADVTSFVEKGNQLSDALKRYPKIFPDLQTTMVASGEIAGKLEEALEQVVTQMKKSHALTSSIKGAMIYPSVVLSAIGVIGVIMVTMVLPKIIALFDEFDAELPLATKLLINTTNFLSQPLNLSIILALFFGAIFLFIFLLRTNRAFKFTMHGIILHLPIIGGIAKKINLARFSITLSSLLKSTIPIVDALHISSKTCKNLHYQDALEQATQRLSKGEQLSEILSLKPKLFPPMVTEMIMVGEKTGEIDHLLQELSTFYSDEVDKIMKNFATIIEPVIIILLGLGVAGIAVAVIMPMFSLTQSF
jgi:type IV pilus assembly protein PilC